MQAIQKQPAFTRLMNLIQSVNKPEYYWITRPLLAFLITRVIVFLSGYLAEIAIPSVTGSGLYHANPNNVFLDIWARWDSSFYLKIAENGYWFQPGQQSGVAFFPVYPLLMSVLKPILGSYLAAGVFVSNVFFLGSLVFLYKLTELEFDDSAASRTVLYIAAFPTSFFFTAVYTESTFLFFSVATLYFARKRLWMWAMLFGLLCSASRIVGMVMWGAVMLEWLSSHDWLLTRIHTRQTWQNLWRGIRLDWLNFVILCLIPAGLFSYMIFLNQQFNDPFAFQTAQSAWGRQTVGPVAAILQDVRSLGGSDFFKGDVWYHVFLNVGAFFVVIVIALAMWRRLGASYALYSLISIVIPASSGTGSLSRYALVIFPVFMMLGLWGRRQWLDRALVTGFSVLLGVLTSLFVNWIFVA